jgi:1-acyl-sn-glycerol-3-phosphate acyltransferase
LFGIKLRVVGRENFDSNKQYIFAPNHSSIIDFQILLLAVNQYCVFVAKKELDRIPIFNTIIKTAGFVLVDRRNNKDAIRSLENLKLDLKKYPRSVAIFPEGSRTKDGNLQDFKKGAAVLGIDTGLPIIPVAIIGSYRWWNTGLFTKTTNIITIIFGDPINTSNSLYEDRNKITMGIKDQITKLRNG